ncbi:MAG: acyl-CoA dehydrogenase family protein [Geobacteraceae bacterium]
MQFTHEHEELRRTISQFVDKEINPYVDEWEAKGRFPAHELFKKMGKLGWLGITKPEAYGGVGLDYSYGLVLAEELGRVRCGAVPMAIGVQTDMATPALARFGSDELCREFLAPSISGDFVACIGVSEPHAGSDVAAIKTTAVKQGGDYIINGTKTWITNSTQGDWVCLLVNTSEGSPYKNKSLIVVPMKTKGITVSDKFDKLGMCASDTAQIFFDDVRVPQRYLIGEEGAGFVYQMLQFQEERMFGSTIALKGMETVIQDTIEYTKQRMAFGKPLLHNQVIHFRLAELQTEVEALRSLIYRACENYIRGDDATKLASMAKLKTGRLSREVSDACLQYWGGMGYMSETHVSRAYRDMRLLSIAGGADEVMLGIICKLMNILPKNR